MHQPKNSSSPKSDVLSNVRSRSESRNPGYLMEALETLADAQPRVARSIPKHAVIDTSNFAARSLDNCLFDSTVYDAMLHDSLKVCEMLQDHLNQCILIARTNCSDGYLEAVPEESEEDTETTCNQNELNNSNCHSTVMTSDILAPSDNG
ncbi:hypothetical protein ACH3XW_27295 [Acanthocheilonema viteae]